MNTRSPWTRRRLLAAATAAALAPAAFATAKRPLVEVYKSPTCGCCGEWIKHLNANGFDTNVIDTGNAAMRAKVGIDVRHGSCHTALVEGYAIEGHVPAREIKRLLQQRPQAIGLAVPGMPIGSPGMDGPVYNGVKQPYDVLLIKRGGATEVFQSYR